jgi:hypothetical protein
MPKRKTPARGKGGRFMKKSKSSGSTAITRRAPSAPVRRSRPRPPARSSGRRRRSHGGSGGSFVGGLKARVRPLVASAAYGWVMTADSGTATKIKGYLAKVPTVEAIGAPATHGILAAFIASRTKGNVRMVFDNLATAALMRAAWNLGSRNFNMSEAAKLSGGGGDLSGEIGPDEAGAYDDELRGDEYDD